MTVYTKIAKSVFIVCFVAFFIIDAAAFAAEKKLNIAMITWRGETKAEKGFKAGLKKLGYHATYQTFDARQDITNLSTILRLKLKPDDFDYIYTFGTTASIRTKLELKEKKPQIFSIVAFPVESGLVKSMNKPGVNISGATHYISVEKQIRNALNFIKFKTLSIPFNPREKNAESSFFKVSDLGKKYGFKVNGYRMAPKTETLQIYLNKLKDKVISADAVYLLSDSYIISQSKTICDVLLKMNIPSIAAVEESVKNGALIGITSDYEEAGRAVAKIVDQHQKGKSLSEIPVATPKSLKILINRKTAAALKIKVTSNPFQDIEWID